MIAQILQQLDRLQVELSTIDPARDCDAADKVAELASALRSVTQTRGDRLPDRSPEREAERHAA